MSSCQNLYSVCSASFMISLELGYIVKRELELDLATKKKKRLASCPPKASDLLSFSIFCIPQSFLPELWRVFPATYDLSGPAPLSENPLYFTLISSFIPSHAVMNIGLLLPAILIRTLFFQYHSLESLHCIYTFAIVQYFRPTEPLNHSL